MIRNLFNYLSALLTILVTLLFMTHPVSAHLAGQPPFFKINGVYTELYDVPTTSLVEFKIPQDKPPALYVVNEIVNFEIDTNALPIPPEVVAQSEFQWDFGDGTPIKNGLKNNHTYSKPGSYFIEITATSEGVSQPQLIQSTIIHIVPYAGYRLPKAKILVNNMGVNDPLLDDVKVEFGKDFELDASSTELGSGKIKEYFWDLGDGKSAKGEKVTYQYSKEQYAMFPVLRVTDENGLFSDAFLQITNNDESGWSPEPTLVNHLHRNRNFITGGILAGLAIVIIPFIFSNLKKKKS